MAQKYMFPPPDGASVLVFLLDSVHAVETVEWNIKKMFFLRAMPMFVAEALLNDFYGLKIVKERAVLATISFCVTRFKQTIYNQ